MISQVTIACAIAALKMARNELDKPSRYFTVEIQRHHQAEIDTALDELRTLRAELLDGAREVQS